MIVSYLIIMTKTEYESMTALEYIENAKSLSSFEYIEKLLSELVSGGNYEITNIFHNDAPYETHWTVKGNIPKGQFFTALHFTLAGWLGATSVQSMYMSENKIELTMNIDKTRRSDISIVTLDLCLTV